MEKDSIFLTVNRAIKAIQSDFRQYDPQLMMFCEVHRLIAPEGVIMTRDASQNGVWVTVPGKSAMRWLAGSELVAYMCKLVDAKEFTPDLLASICARVFRTRAWTAVDSRSGILGIWIETGMEGFHCRQCGHCCKSLEYRNELTAEDVARWKKQNRRDIWQWVGECRRGNGKTGYRMWVNPDTRRFVDICPFIEERSAENRWICKIHHTKPKICRNYPVSRKHGLMTGCPGFERRPLKTKPRRRQMSGRRKR